MENEDEGKEMLEKLQWLQHVNMDLETQLQQKSEKYQLLQDEYMLIKRDCETFQNTADNQAEELNEKNNLLIKKIEDLESVRSEYEQAFKKATDLETSLFDKISNQ